MQLTVMSVTFHLKMAVVAVGNSTISLLFFVQNFQMMQSCLSLPCWQE